MDLYDWGWDPFFEEQFKKVGRDDLIPARVTAEERGVYRVWCASGELEARVSGRLRAEARGRIDFPVVGDWTAAARVDGEAKAVIHRVLPRRTRFLRKLPVSGGKKPGWFEGEAIMDGGLTAEQPIASNIDTLFIVVGLDLNFRPRRIERFLVQAAASGARPAVLLNKADLCPDLGAKLAAAESAAPGVPVLAVSALRGEGLEGLRPFLARGKTAAFIGSSGVGKSSLINALLGEARQKVTDISGAVGKGRHTTTSRDLILCREGGLLLDTPGLRELQLWCEAEEVEMSFEEIAALSAGCRFSDCRHQSEPDCAVKNAIAGGTLSAARYEEYQRYRREVRYLDMKKEQRSRLIGYDKADRMGFMKKRRYFPKREE